MGIERRAAVEPSVANIEYGAARTTTTTRVLLLLLSRYYLFISFIYLQHTRTPPRQSSALFMERMSLGGGWEHVPLVHTCREEKRSFVTKIIIFISQNPLIISL